MCPTVDSRTEEVENDDVGYLSTDFDVHQDYVWKMPTVDRIIVEESTSSWLDGRQRAGVEVWIAQAGACKVGGMLLARPHASNFGQR